MGDGSHDLSNEGFGDLGSNNHVVIRNPDFRSDRKASAAGGWDPRLVQEVILAEAPVFPLNWTRPYACAPPADWRSSGSESEDSFRDLQQALQAVEPQIQSARLFQPTGARFIKPDQTFELIRPV